MGPYGDLWKQSTVTETRAAAAVDNDYDAWMASMGGFDDGGEATVKSPGSPCLKALLGRLNLTDHCATLLADAGVEEAKDLLDWSEDELIKEGIKRGHAKKMLKAVKATKGAATAAKVTAAFVPEVFYVPRLGNSGSIAVTSRPDNGDGLCRFGCGAEEGARESAHHPSCPNGRGQ